MYIARSDHKSRCFSLVHDGKMYISGRTRVPVRRARLIYATFGRDVGLKYEDSRKLTCPAAIGCYEEAVIYAFL